jgi:16S rRNA (cytosine1402-N4)-methyltransferase
MHVMRTQTHSQSSSGFDTDPTGYEHTPVLLQEVINALALEGNECFVDGTLGLGGHAIHVLPLLSQGALFIGLDKDADALHRAEMRIGKQQARCVFKNASFESLEEVLIDEKLSSVDRILLDLGWGTHTIHSGRGFSFMYDEPLQMTYEKSAKDDGLTAKEILNTWSAESLLSIIQGWGEEQYARRIVDAICKEREKKEIATTGQLTRLIEKVIPRRGKTHPATKTFQALRITVNNELAGLEDALKKHFSLLSPHGRLAVITFHSLEDRIVKHVFKELAAATVAELYSKKAIQAGDIEKRENPRSRSAKLRVCIKK